MLEALVSKIRENTDLNILGKKYKVHSKVYYVTKSNPTNGYYKLKLDSNKSVVIIPSDELIYIGEIIENMNYKQIDENTIMYKNKKYNKVTSDYQIVRNVEFGNSYEKECDFTDYNEENGNTIISLAMLTENGERADVFAEIIDISEVKIEKD